jgi:hypothetical protein
MRKAFNFYKSYYDVLAELNDTEKLKFLMALLNKQFYNVEPDLKGMAKFAYISQKHSIDKQVIGYQDKTKEKLTPMVGGLIGGSVGGCQQEKEKGQGKEEEKDKLSIDFDIFWNLYDKKEQKENCIKIWEKLDIETQKIIVEILPEYVKYKSDKKFRPNPQTFLNQKRWLDEIPKSTQSSYISQIPKEENEW